MSNNPNPQNLEAHRFVGTYTTDLHRVDMYKVESKSFDEIKTEEDLLEWIELNSNVYLGIQLKSIKVQIKWLEFDINEIHTNGSMVQIETYTALNTKVMKYLNFSLSLIGKTGKDTVIGLNTPVRYIEGEDLFISPGILK